MDKIFLWPIRWGWAGCVLRIYLGYQQQSWGSERMEWNGMEWNGMEWNGMEWNGLE